MRRFLKWTLAAGALSVVAGSGLAACAYEDMMGAADDTQFTRDHILQIIAQESPVTYNDGTTRLGAFFDQEHRIYVPFAELPKDWVNAIVAAEDSNFWTHHGVDPKHVVRAAKDNVVAGHVVAGGSTITQQTAKNLFYRPDRSWHAKSEELANALKLEEHFSKEDILEFYANQFHVVGNGRGLGIAARYFFDKAPKALTLKECAFLAGFVKAPSTYNPFLGATEERRDAARRTAEERTAYVLRRMEEVGYITAAQHKDAAATPLVFRRGTFQFDRSVAVDAVERRLEDPDLVELFARAGIENPATAGISITTTLDATVQREATWALVHHLSELGPQLEGPLALALPPSTSMPNEPGAPLVAHQLYVARVASTGPTLGLDVGGRPCTVDADGVARAAKIGDVAGLAVDQLVRASVREGALCDLEARPELQGAVVVLDHGQLVAMVGGSDNRNFDRTTAPRQFGSTWKPVLYAAALQLGWLPGDTLDNRPNVFPFRDVWYYPRADHASEPWVSMNLAGARSENLASVWLLAHLTDRLNAEQFRRVATLVGVYAQAGEAPAAWMTRLQKDGITSSPERFEEYAFAAARDDAGTGLAFGAHPEDAAVLRSMVYGRGVAAERAKQARGGGHAEHLAMLDATWLAVADAYATCAQSGWMGEGCVDATATPDTPADPLVLGKLHKSTIEEVQAALVLQTRKLAGRDPWELDVLALNPDVRQLVGIRYLQKLVASMGVTEELPTNLTLPLGAADVSLLEMASVYQGFLGGTHYRFAGTGLVDTDTIGLRDSFPLPAIPQPAALVSGVKQSDGDALFRLEPTAEPVADPLAGELVGGILRNVVRVGTGRRAEGAVSVGGVKLPLAGKTGTTNGYRNAAFLGFVPRVKDGKATWADGYTVGVYVGYDDNRTMKKGSLHVQGANGALPAWLGVARGLASAGLLGAKGVAEYTPSAGLAVVDGPPPLLTLSDSVRRFAPLTDPAVNTAASPEPTPPPPATPVAEAPPTGEIEEVAPDPAGQ